MDMSYMDDNKNKGYRIAVGGLKLVIRILLLVLIVVMIMIGGRRLYALGYEAFSVKPLAETAAEGENIAVVVTSDMSVREIGELLIDSGLIDESPAAFVIQAYVYGYAHSIVPKAYVLNTSMTISEMLEFMSRTEEEEED